MAYTFGPFKKYSINYPKNERNYLNDSFEINSNTFENIFNNNNSCESDDDSNERFFWPPTMKSNQNETEAIRNIQKNGIIEKKEEKSEKKEQKNTSQIICITRGGTIEKKEEKSEKKEQKNTSPIICITMGGIPSEEKIDGKAKNNKKNIKRRHTENTEKTAYSSENSEEQQNQLNEENKKMSELNEINKEGNIDQLIIIEKKDDIKISNNNINSLNNNDENSEKNVIDQTQIENIESNKIGKIMDDVENNLNVIITNNNHDTDTNSYKSRTLINNKRKRSRSNKLIPFNPDKIRKKIRIMSLSSAIIFINKMIKIIYKNDIRKSILIRQFLQINKKNLSHSSVEFDKKFLHKKLKEILSDKISEKYSNYPSDKNKKLVEELISSDIGGPYFKNLFELTFLDCLEHIRGSKKFSELMGLMNMDEMLNYEEFKIDKNDILLYKEHIIGYEKIINEKKSRDSKKARKE